MEFRTETGQLVPAVTAAQMREVDRIAIEQHGLGILQMMENAGRSLAQHVMEMLDGATGPVMVLAGSGGNGGGGVCCARHLHNHGVKVYLALNKSASTLTGATLNQVFIAQASGLRPIDISEVDDLIDDAPIVVDALIGYSLYGSAEGEAADLIEIANERAQRILSLDVPSGLNATTGEAEGPVICPTRTLTLALPKTGLAAVSCELYVADIGIAPALYRQVGITVGPFFGPAYWVKLAVDSVLP
jgi:NAD(P)H-hydrate epimerase